MHTFCVGIFLTNAFTRLCPCVWNLCLVSVRPTSCLLVRAVSSNGKKTTGKPQVVFLVAFTLSRTVGLRQLLLWLQTEDHLAAFVYECSFVSLALTFARACQVPASGPGLCKV